MWTQCTFGSLGDRKRWKYDMQAYDDIFNRVLKPTRVDPSSNSETTTTTSPITTTTTSPITTTTTNSETTTTTGITEGFENGKKDKQDTCVTCRAGYELWIIGLIMALFIGIIIWAICD